MQNTDSGTSTPALKDAMHSEREVVLTALRKNKIDGKECSMRLSNISDHYIKSLAQTHFSTLENSLCVMLTGGNGRQDTCPHSDLDVLVLIPGNQEPDNFQEHYTNFCTDLYDMFKKVLPIASTPDERIARSKHDHITATSLIDARAIWGQDSLADELRQKFEAERQGRAENYAKDAASHREARLSKPANERYVLQGHIKEGYGGLRDYQSARWLGKMFYNAPALQDLVSKDIIKKCNADRVEAAHGFLLTMRCHLHDIAGREEDMIRPDLQVELAKRFGGDESKAAVENFMNKYFQAIRDIGFVANILSARAIEDCQTLKDTDLQMPSGFIQRGNHILFPENELKDSNDALRIIARSLDSGLDLHYTALQEIREKIDLIQPIHKDNTEAGVLFTSILMHSAESAFKLRQMQELGLLQKLIPAFEDIDTLLQFDPYHRLTVDEHSFECLEMMHRLEAGEFEDEAALSTSLFEQLTTSERRALYTGILLHDIGKTGSPHEKIGAEIAADICPHLGLVPEETDKVKWLIAKHLILSQTAQYKDPGDPKTILEFYSHVPERRLLNLLTILTTADMMGVNEECWTWSRASNISSLYKNAEAYLVEAKLRSDPRLHLPEDYTAGETTISIRNDFNRHATIVDIISPDKSHLFQNLLGTISGMQFNVLEMDAHTTNDETPAAINRFIIQNTIQNCLEERQITRLRSEIGTIIAANNTQDASALGEKIEKMKKPGQDANQAYPIKTNIDIDNNVSQRNTYIKVTARDRYSLLYDLSRVFNTLGLDLKRARITTHGHKAVDSFYLRERNGRKIAPERFDDIRAAIKPLICD